MCGIIFLILIQFYRETTSPFNLFLQEVVSLKEIDNLCRNLISKKSLDLYMNIMNLIARLFIYSKFKYIRESKGGKSMLTTNKEKVVKWSVQGKIHHPLGGGYRITHDGIPMILPATGGISYNVKIGDSAYEWAGDAGQRKRMLFW